jgi:isopenicillin N synthase-like dioxygenase
MTTPAIPTVDLAALSSDSPSARAEAADALIRGYAEVGLVYVAGHGLDPSAVDALHDAFLAVLDRPEAEKRRWGGPEIWYQRGWTPPNTERAVVAGGQPDFKECFFAAPMPLDPHAAALYPELYCDNVWPSGADAFREGVLALGAAVHAVGLDLLRGCALGLDLAPGSFTDLVGGAAHVTRLLKYLPLAPEQVGTGVLWGEEHTDFNLLTIIPSGRFVAPDGTPGGHPGGGGLSLRTRPAAGAPLGVQVKGTTPPGCIVSQVGQQLEILTGGRLTATPHVISAPDEPGWVRTSMAHFVHVHALTPLFPLEPFRTREAIEAYRPPVLAGTYDLKTLVDIGLAPVSILDRFGYRHYDRLAAFRAEEATR